MNQVSRPLQILLVAVLLFGAVYMLALRPKSGGATSTPAKPANQATTSPAQGPGSSIPGGLGTLREVNIREVITFPKTATGADPLTGAPAPVDPRQLRELGLRVERDEKRQGS